MMWESTLEVRMASLSDLTPRELEILQLLLTGKTNKEIPKEIFISERTVEFHLDHIYTKIGMRSRMMAGIWAIEHRIAEETGKIHS
jgi:DNA-binding NarL/FixJ family response regulator